MNPASSRSTNRMLLVPLLGLMILLALCSGSALAAETGVVKFFGGKGSEGGKFGSIYIGVSLAINQTGAGGAGVGDVYVPDPLNHRVQQFSASGEFIRAFGLGVGGPGVDVCTVASDCVEGESSSAAGGMAYPTGVAVDPSTGVVYVSDVWAANRRISVFSATGEFEGAFGWNVKVSGGAEELQFCTVESGCKAGVQGNAPGQFRPGEGFPAAPITVSPLNGHVLFADRGNGRVQEFAPTIEGGKVTGISYLRSYNGEANGEARDVAVDQSGEIYLLGYKTITTYSPAGSPEGTLVEFDASHSGSASLEINSLNGNLLLNSSTVIREYTHSGEQLATYLQAAGSNGTPFIADLALNQQSGTIYLTTTTPESGVLVLGEPVPPTVSVEAVTTFTGTTATFKGHVNPKGFFADYHFEYSADGVKWTKLPEKELPADSEEHAVSQEATGLVGHTHYQVRLVAEKSLGGGTASAETSFETPAAAPVISAVGIEEITDTTAKPTAKLNSENEATSYHFECVSQAQFEASGYAEAVEAPSGGASLDASGETVQVSVQLSGLSPTTAYRCRFTASNASGPVTSPEEATFATFASQPLGPPDGRAYEQVTPVDKNGGDARGVKFTLRAAPGGEGADYVIPGSGATEGGGGQHLGVYSALRGGSSWNSHNFWPDVSFGNFATMIGWSEDMRRGYVVAGDFGGALTLYEQDLESGAMTAIVGGIVDSTLVNFTAESADGSKTLFESEEALVTGATAGWSNLYLWNRNTHKLSLVDLLSNGTQPFHGAFPGPYDWVVNNPKNGGASVAPGGGYGYYTQQLHALSKGGSTLFFTSYNVAQLYARTGLDTASPKTVQVSASQKTNGSGSGGKDPKGPQKAAFMEATPDGRYVFFTSSEELTNDATTGTADQGNDLYRYDTQSGELIDIAPDTSDANGAEVQGVIGSSADGSDVYFAANRVLAPGASAGSCDQSSGTCSIYLWHEGQISYVAQTGGGVSQGDDLNRMPANRVTGSGVLPMKTGRVSANGTLLFLSKLSPTSYDSEGKQEVYRYEPGADLGCVSCNPTGAGPLGDATMQSFREGFAAPAAPSAIWVRNLSANGRRVFFETSDQLVANDINHQTDVYEWEAKGEGSCESEGQNGGCIYLISTGESNEPSYFADASENGDDVFFFTRQQLVRQDTDRLQDLYDARIGGGIASQNEAPPPQCEGEACKGPAPQAPGAESAGSTTFSGPGNPKPAHAKKKKRHAKKHGHKGKKKHASNGRAGR